MDFSDQEAIFGTLLGSMPTRRARTNGLVVYKGYVVAEFGDTTWVDPTYSVAKSMLATVAARGRSRRRDRGPRRSRSARLVDDGGYASPHNAQVTWRMHLQQETRVGGQRCGARSTTSSAPRPSAHGERKPRELQTPGTFYEYNDIRINRFALSLLRVFGSRSRTCSATR